MIRVAALRALLAACLLLGPGVAARADSLHLGGTYSGSLSMVVDGVAEGHGGGNIGGSSGTVGGNSFGFLALYCVDMFTGASLNTTYTATFNKDGVINGQALPTAGQIAWLMLNIAPTLTMQAQFQALQGLIWELESPMYGHTMQFNTAQGANSAAAIGYYNSYVSALGSNSAPVDSVWWINPVNSQGSYAYQGMVGVSVLPPLSGNATVPEPASMALLGGGLVALAGVRRWARRRG